MDIQTIQTLISGLGFPIACCVGLGIFIFTIWKSQRQDFNEQMKSLMGTTQTREERLYQQMEKYNGILSDMVETLAKIDARISILENVVADKQKEL